MRFFPLQFPNKPIKRGLRHDAGLNNPTSAFLNSSSQHNTTIKLRYQQQLITMAGNRRGGGMKIDLPPVPLGVVVAFMEPTYPKPIPPESYNPFDIAFDLERGFQGRFQSKEDFEAKKREYLARRNGQGKAQVDLVKYPGCLDDLPITEADRNVWRKKLFGATTSGCWGEIQV